MLFCRLVYLFTLLQAFGLCYASTLPDIQLPPPSNSTEGPSPVFDFGDLNNTLPNYGRPTRYGVPGTGGRGEPPRVTLIVEWHLTKFQQREADFLILRSLDRLVQTTIRMSAGDEPILNGKAAFRSASLKIVARDTVLLGGFTYGVLATALRGLGELLSDWGATGMDADVYVEGKRVGTMGLDFVI